MASPTRIATMFSAGALGFIFAMYGGFTIVTDQLNPGSETEPTPTEIRTARELRQASNDLIAITNTLTDHIHAHPNANQLQYQHETMNTLLAQANAVRQRLIHSESQHPILADLLACADRLTAAIQSPENTNLRKILLSQLTTSEAAITVFITEAHAADHVPERIPLAQ